MHSRGSRNSCLPSLSILLETQTYDPLFSSTSVEFRTAISLEEVTYVVRPRQREEQRSENPIHIVKMAISTCARPGAFAQNARTEGTKPRNTCLADSSFAGEDWPVGWRSPRILNRLTDGCGLLHLRHFFERRNQKDAQLFVAWLALRCTTSSDRANEVSESSPTSRKP